MVPLAAAPLAEVPRDNLQETPLIDGKTRLLHELYSQIPNSTITVFFYMGPNSSPYNLTDGEKNKSLLFNHQCPDIFSAISSWWHESNVRSKLQIPHKNPIESLIFRVKIDKTPTFSPTASGSAENCEMSVPCLPGIVKAVETTTPGRRLSLENEGRWLCGGFLK